MIDHERYKKNAGRIIYRSYFQTQEWRDKCQATRLLEAHKSAKQFGTMGETLADALLSAANGFIADRAELCRLRVIIAGHVRLAAKRRAKKWRSK